MNTLKLKNQVGTRLIVVSVVYGIMAIYITSYFITLNGFVEQDHFSSVFRGVVLFIDFMVIVSIWSFIVRARTVWNYRIVFNEDNVRENKALTPFASPKEISYNQIKSVSYDWPGFITISGVNDAKLKIYVKNVEGGRERVLDALKTYLPNDVIENHLSEKIDRSRLYEKNIPWVYLQYS